MKIINVELTITPELKVAYEQFIDELVTSSRSEAGNISYNHFKKLGNDTDYEIIEHWQDANAVAVHNGTAHFQKFLAGVGKFLTQDPIIIRMDYND